MSSMQDSHSLYNPLASSSLDSITNTVSDLMVFSHLRWDFVFQRPQHLLTRFSKHRRVFFVEEPVFDRIGFGEHVKSWLERKPRDQSLTVIVPHLKEGLSELEVHHELRVRINELIDREEIDQYTAWYYTPMALAFTDHLSPEVIIFDCMDELSAFKNAPPLMLHYESELFRIADLVFTGGESLYDAKKHRHNNIHCFPSSIDRAHFSKARTNRRDRAAEPEDQAKIRGPRIGFFGVIDERMDAALLEAVARLRPDWSFVMIGPVAKIDSKALPRLPNLHYLGMKHYQELPHYLSGWDLAILPFARNESTRFISPTKTPEYLAAGCPVVSTSIRDVIRPYSEEGLVYIADTPVDFVNAAEFAMKQAVSDPFWLKRVDAFLADKSWDHTCNRMAILENEVRASKLPIPSYWTHPKEVFDGQYKA